MKQLTAPVILLVAAAAAAAPMGTAFHWQGTLTHEGAPADGLWDLQFALYATPETAVPEIGPVIVEDVAVEAGRVIADVDFGPLDDAAELWLEVGARPGATTGAFSVLGPRHLVGATPYVRHAARARTADSAVTADSAEDADTLDGQHAAYYLSWGSFTGVPGDIADGDDDTLAGLSCADDQLAKFDGSSWACADDELGHAFARTVVVGAGDDAAANGTALLAAMAAVPTPASADEGWLIRLDPGSYDLGSSTLVMKPWTVVAGADRELTTITSSRCCTQTATLLATVNAAASAELRDVTVLNTCDPVKTGQKAAAVSNSQPGAVFRRITAFCPGRAEYDHGLVNTGSDVIIDRVNAYGGSDVAEYGCGLESTGANTTILDTVAMGTHGGLRVTGSNTRVLRGSFTATGSGLAGFDPIGIEVEGANVQVMDANADGDPAVSAAAYTASATITMSRVAASGGVLARANPGRTLVLAFEHSRISSSGATVDADTNVMVGIAATQLEGDPVAPGGGVIGCAGVWDEGWVFSANVCP